ncbi:MAG TPA: hypothetical protein VF625_12985 [Longimicrobium sp.]|jgi:hypothetical protein
MTRSSFPHLIRTPLLALAALTLATGAAAQTSASGPSVRFVVEGVLEAGGDEVATVTFQDGDTQTVRSGQGGTLAVGGHLRLNQASPFGVRATAGFKYVTTAADNAHITLTRIPLELVGTYELPNGVNFAAGFVRHTAIKFSADGVGDDLEFEDANGGTAELGWKWVALTYTVMRYTDVQGGEYTANNAGVSLRYFFGR